MNLVMMLMLLAPTLPDQKYILVTSYKDVNYLVIHAEVTNKVVDSNVQVWPNGKVRIKGSPSTGTVNFWKGIFIMSPATKGQVCK